MPPAKNKPQNSDEQPKDAAPVEGAASTDQDAAPVESTPKDIDPAKHDETDVPAALQRTTYDGKGDDEVPPSDFQSFATDDVEEKSVTVLAEEVLQAKHGARRIDALLALEKQGHDVAAINDEISRLLRAGRPTSLLRSEM